MVVLHRRPRACLLLRGIVGVLIVLKIVETSALIPASRLKLPNVVSKVSFSHRTVRPLRRQLLQDGRRGETALSMGIRSLIGGLKKGKDKGDDKDEEKASPSKEDTNREAPPHTRKDVLSKAKTKIESVKQRVKSSKPAPKKNLTPDPPKPVRMGEDPSTGEVNVRALDRQESVQERINRVKSGQMTEEEKEAFLQTALSAGNTAESRKPLRASTPAEEAEARRRGLASPFPTDSILRDFARGKNATASGKVELDKTKLDSQKKKKEYLDMVTNPDRFNRYKAVDKTAPATASTPEPTTPSLGLERISGSTEKERKTSIPDITNIVKETKASPRSTESPASGVQPLYQPPAAMPEDLGARLEAAAMATEKLRREQERLLEEELRIREQQLEEERRERERVSNEAARQRQEEIARREREVQEQRRMEEERIQREEEEEKLKEKRRLDELMKAQEEYWNKKLASEREKKLSRNQKEDEEAGDKPVEVEASSPSKPEASSPSKPKVSPPSKPVESAKNFNPDEHELLEEAEHDREEDWEHNQETIERKAAEIRGTPPALNNVQTEQRFLDERAERKREIDRLHDEQLRRLKELNSPLPSPPSNKSPPTYPPAFQQNRSVPRSTPATTTNFQPQQLAGSTKKGDSADKPLSIADLTKKADDPPPKKPEPVYQSAWSKLIGNNKKDSEEEKPANKTSPPASKLPIKTPTAKTSDPPPVKRGPIRMQLPLGDDIDDTDDEEGIDAKANKSMSIADAMKRTTQGGTIGQEERSKKWGIDISKFADD